MKLWHYTGYIEDVVITGILRQMSAFEPDGTFEGTFISLRTATHPINLTHIKKCQKFRQGDEDKGYTVYPIEDPNDVLKGIL